MSAKRRFEEASELLQAHRNFWNNSPGTVLRSQTGYSREAYRQRIYRQNIKGELTPEKVDVKQIVEDTVEIYRDLPLRNGDAFEFVQFAYVIPWTEAIIGCRLFAMGRGGSITAKPALMEADKLPQHLRDTLANLEDNPWFRKLADGQQALTAALGDKFPIAPVNMRGPGDMVGALLGQQNFVERMLEPEQNRKYLNELLDLSTRIFLETARMQCDQAIGTEWGYCNAYGIWAPNPTARSQEDIASLLTPAFYAEYLLPYEVQIADAFEYTVFHMHSSLELALYNWKAYCRQSTINSLEIALDHIGPKVKDILEILTGMNSERPLVLDSYAPGLAEEVEEHIAEFPGAILHTWWDQSLP